MTSFEFVSLLFSGIAVLVSLIVWNGQRRMQREANDLQRVMADLSKKQLQLIKEAESVKHQAKLALDLVREGKGYRLVLTNKSTVDAIAVDLKPKGVSLDESFVPESEFTDKFPHKRLRGGEQIRLIAAPAMGTPPVSEFLATWQNSDGSTAIEEFSVSL